MYAKYGRTHRWIRCSNFKDCVCVCVCVSFSSFLNLFLSSQMWNVPCSLKLSLFYVFFLAKNLHPASTPALLHPTMEFLFSWLIRKSPRAGTERCYFWQDWHFIHPFSAASLTQRGIGLAQWFSVLSAHWSYPRGFYKVVIVARESDLIGVGWGSFKSPPDDSNMKARLGTTELNPILIPYPPKQGNMSL